MKIGKKSFINSGAYSNFEEMGIYLGTLRKKDQQSGPKVGIKDGSSHDWAKALQPRASVTAQMSRERRKKQVFVNKSQYFGQIFFLWYCVLTRPGS